MKKGYHSHPNNTKFQCPYFGKWLSTYGITTGLLCPSSTLQSAPKFYKKHYKSAEIFVRISLLFVKLEKKKKGLDLG